MISGTCSGRVVSKKRVTEPPGGTRSYSSAPPGLQVLGAALLGAVDTSLGPIDREHPAAALEPPADEVRCLPGTAPDLEHVVVRLHVDEVHRPPQPGRDRLHRHEASLPELGVVRRDRQGAEEATTRLDAVESSQIRVGVLGSRGKVGSAVCAAVDEADDLTLVASVDQDDPIDGLVSSGVQVVVDFTHPDVVMDNLEFCVDHGIHAVVGTTGFDDERLDTLRHWLGDAPSTGVLVAPN